VKKNKSLRSLVWFFSIAVLILISLLGSILLAHKRLIEAGINYYLKTKGVEFKKAYVTDYYSLVIQDFKFKNLQVSTVTISPKFKAFKLVGASIYFNNATIEIRKGNKAAKGIKLPLQLDLVGENLVVKWKEFKRKFDTVLLRKLGDIVEGYAKGKNCSASVNGKVLRFNTKLSNFWEAFVPKLKGGTAEVKLALLFNLSPLKIKDWKLTVKVKGGVLNYKDLQLQVYDALISKSYASPKVVLESSKGLLKALKRVSIGLKGEIWPEVSLSGVSRVKVLGNLLKLSYRVYKTKLDIVFSSKNLSGKAFFEYNGNWGVKANYGGRLGKILFCYNPKGCEANVQLCGFGSAEVKMEQKEGEFIFNLGKVINVASQIEFDKKNVGLRLKFAGNAISLIDFYGTSEIYVNFSKKNFIVLDIDAWAKAFVGKILRVHLVRNKGNFELLGRKFPLELSIIPGITIKSSVFNVAIDEDFDVNGTIFDWNLSGSLKKLGIELRKGKWVIDISTSEVILKAKDAKLVTLFESVKKIVGVNINGLDARVSGEFGLVGWKPFARMIVKKFTLSNFERYIDLKDMHISSDGDYWLFETSGKFITQKFKVLGKVSPYMDRERFLKLEFVGSKNLLLGGATFEIMPSSVNFSGTISLKETTFSELNDKILRYFKSKKGDERVKLPKFLNGNLYLDVRGLTYNSAVVNVRFSGAGKLQIKNGSLEVALNLTMKEGNLLISDDKLIPLTDGRVVLSYDGERAQVRYEFDIARKVKGGKVYLKLHGDYPSFKVDISSDPKMSTAVALSKLAESYGIKTTELAGLLKDSLIAELLSSKVAKKLGLGYLRVDKGGVSVVKKLGKGVEIKYSAGEKDGFKVKLKLNEEVFFTIGGPDKDTENIFGIEVKTKFK